MANRKRTPPVEEGRRLATCDRGPLEELRITWQEYQGHPFVNVRVWERGTDGAWYPKPDRGVALKVRELLRVSHAIDAAVRISRGEDVQVDPPDPPL
jgi:hypothetical protein